MTTNIDQQFDLNGLIGKPSGGDFTTAYASATTLTLGTLPGGASVTADDIVAVVQLSGGAGGAVVATYTRDDKTMSMSSNTLTVTEAEFGASDAFVVYTNIPRSGGALDDGAFTIGTNVQPTGMLADNSSPDSVDEGDVGIPRMSLDRIPYGQNPPSVAHTLASVAVSASSFTVQAANAGRKGMIIYNDGSANVYVKAGATASTSSFNWKMVPNSSLTLPEVDQSIYTGVIDAIGDSATGNLRVTEVT